MEWKARRGKIAKLPHALREELNGRLHRGESRKRCCAWLNGLPAVKALLAEHFSGEPITNNNVHQWYWGGYQEYLRTMAKRPARLQPAREKQLIAKGAAAQGRMDKGIEKLLRLGAEVAAE